jgi:glucan phosphoethanolaminetransferase (alkaline phosphatase superfamily)
MSARHRGWWERLIISILNFFVTNLFNLVLQKKHTGVDPHYFDVWEPAHQGNTDAAERLVTISFYYYAIFVIFILYSIFCSTNIRRN